MSNEKSPPTPWSDQDIERLIKRAQEGMPNNIIAAELQYYNRTAHTKDDVAKMRAELKLSPEPGLPSKNPQEKPTLSAAKISSSKKAGPKTSRKKSGALDETFEEAAAEPKEAVVLPTGELKFTPVYPEKAAFKKGEIYIVPGIGASRYDGLQSVTIPGGGEMETMSFLALYPSGGNSAAHKFTPAKLKDKGVRLPASPEFFHELVVRMENDMLPKLVFPGKAGPRKEFMEQIIQSADPLRVAGLVRQCFKDTSASTNISHGNIGLEMLSSEFAASTGIDRKLAYLELASASGKPNIDQLMLDKALNNGRKPRAP